jgi:pyruvate dehydrogenase E2 component (dihydrolipoamide acetyltransferase)
MPVYIEMPKLSDTMTEGTLVKWRKKNGDKVEAGDILAEVETDKATMEMEAFDDGILTETYVPEGGKVAVGQKIALLLAPGEKAPTEAPAPAAAKPAAAAAEPKTAATSPAPNGTPAAVATAPGARVKASPLAKKIAASKGIDLTRVIGTGPAGRITARDLDAAPAAPKSAAPVSGAVAASAAVASMPAGPNDQRLPLSGMRKVIAERLLTSKTTIPHFYLNIEADAAELMQLRAEANAGAEKNGQPKLTVNDFILKAAIVAATKVPKVNASFAGDAVIQYASINLAVAVAIDDGLVTPVIRDAQKKSLREINEIVKDLATRARNKKLKPEEYAGGTITVSNLGAYGIDNFFAIVNPPQAIILAVGAVVKKPVVNAKNEIVAGQRVNIGLSCDHRVVDGAIGAEYLAELRKLIENPALMLI